MDNLYSFQWSCTGQFSSVVVFAVEHAHSHSHAHTHAHAHAHAHSIQIYCRIQTRICLTVSECCSFIKLELQLNCA